MIQWTEICSICWCLFQLVYVAKQSDIESSYFTILPLRPILTCCDYSRYYPPFLSKINYKQNRESTEGYSWRKVERRHGKFGKTGLNNLSTSKSQKGGWNQVFGRVSVPCRHATPVANALRKPLVIRLGIQVMKLVGSLIGWEVTVTGQGSECHLTFVRGRLHIAE